MDINININYNNIKKIQVNFILIAILFTATLLRIYNLGFQGAWLDEIHTLKEADPNLTLKEFHEIIMWREAIPHFYFLIVRYFFVLFGNELVIARLVSAICGIITVLGLYKLGKELVSERVGYIAAIIATFHPFLIEYSQEGRSYAMLALFVTFSFYYLVKFLKNVNLKNAILLGLFSGLITNAQPIGIVNVLSIYLCVLIVFILEKDKTIKINLLKYTILSGLISLLVFSPVYLIVSKLINGQNVSSWIPKPTLESVILVFVNVSGKSILLFLMVIVSYILTLILFKKQDQKSLIKINFQTILILSVWIFFFLIFMLLKSKDGASLILHRYFISLTPAFIIITSIPISFISNKITRNIALTTIVFTTIYVIFIQNNYYNTRVKSQFGEVCEQVQNENKNENIVISNWRWLLSYFLDRDNKIKSLNDKNLDLYISEVKSSAVIQEDFWYVDGNSRPYSVTPETQFYLDENYKLDKYIKLHDCWAKHYISNKPVDLTSQKIKLNQFIDAQFDGVGRLMFVNNGTLLHPKVNLEKGEYILAIKGFSLPEKPINGENSHLNIIVNNKNIGGIYLSNIQDQKPHLIIFKHIGGVLNLALNYDNDMVLGAMDRNALINSISLSKK